MNDKEEGEEGEKEESELEEGELSDGDDARPEETEPRPVCRFYNRGQCTWGVSCRFLHPGVTDKGNYTMFDMVRPMAYPPHAATPHEYRPHIDRPNIRPLPGGYGAPAHTPKVEETPTESAWERGLRHAKEVSYYYYKIKLLYKILHVFFIDRISNFINNDSNVLRASFLKKILFFPIN